MLDFTGILFTFASSMRKRNLGIVLNILVLTELFQSSTSSSSENCRCTSSNFTASSGVRSNATCSNSASNDVTRCTFVYKSCTGTCNRQSHFSSASTFYSWVQSKQRSLENFDCTNKTQICPQYGKDKCSNCPVSEHYFSSRKLLNGGDSNVTL